MRRWSSVLFLISVAGCQANLGVPPSAQLICQTNADCPPTDYCNSSGLCEPTDSSHTTLPVVTFDSVTPSIGTKNTTFTVAVTANKVLQSPPTLTLDLVPPRTFPSCSAPAGSLVYTCSYTSDGTENDSKGGVVTFGSQITDNDGNTVKQAKLGELDFDFAPPSLVYAEVAPAFAGHDATITISFTSNKELVIPDGGIQILRSTSDAGLPATNVGTLDFEGQEVLTDSAGGGDPSEPNGPITYSVVLSDIAGNTSMPLTIGSTTVDQTVPTISMLQASSADGGIETQFSEQPGFNVLNVQFDVTKPVDAAGQLTVTLKPTPPSPSTEEIPISCPQSQAASPNYSCQYQITGQEVPGLQTITVTTLDEAGNTNSLATNVNFDFSPPVTMASVSPNPAKLNDAPVYTVAANKAITVICPASATGCSSMQPLIITPDTMHPTPTRMLPAYTTPTMSSASTAWSFQFLPVTGQLSGYFDIGTTVVDDVGHSVDVPLAMPLYVNAIPPVLSNPQTFEGSTSQPASRFSHQEGFDSILLTFASSSALDPTKIQALFGLCPGTPNAAPCAFSACAPVENTPNTYSCTYTVQGNEETGDGTAITNAPWATLPVEISARDAVGNLASIPVSITLDFNPPELVASSASVPNAGLGIVESLHLTANETLSAQGPTITVTGPNGALGFMPVSATQGADYDFAYTVAAGDGQGPCSWTLVLTDVVGNTTPMPLIGDAFNIDAIPPTITSLTTGASVYSEVSGHNIVTVWINTVKSVDTPPSALNVLLNGHPMTSCGPYQTTIPDYTCTYDISMATDTAGPQPITVTTVDEAGNTDAATATVSFDFTALSLQGSIAPHPTQAGQTPVFSVSSNKPLSNAPTPAVTQNGSASNALGMPASGGSGTAWTFVYPTATTSVIGSFALSASATDAVGHQFTVNPPIPFQIDEVAPTVSSIQVGSLFSEVAPYNLVTLTFGVPKSLDTPGDTVSATVGGQPMTCGTWSPTAMTYTCTYTVTLNDAPSGVKSIVIQTQDEVGNTGSGSVAVTFDLSSLTVLGTVSPNPAKLGSIPVLTLTTNKPIPTSNPPTITSVTENGSPSTALASPAPSAAGAGTSWTFTFPQANAALTGTFNINSEAVDDVGHVGTASTPLFFVDTVGPVISGVATAAARYSAVSGYNDLVLTFNSSKSVDPSTGTDAGPSLASLSVAMGTSPAYALKCGTFQKTTPSYTCTYTVTGSEQYNGTPIRQLSQAIMPIVITAVDEAGNVSTGGASVTLDFAPPVLLGTPLLTYLPGAGNPLSSVAAATVGTTAQVSFSVNENLLSNPTVVFSGTGANGFAMSPTSASGTAYVYAQVIARAGTPADGTYELAITVTDVVDNSTTLTVSPSPALAVHTTPPAAVVTTTSGLVTYTRVPFGEGSTSGVASFTLTGGTGAVPGCVEALAFDGPSSVTADTLGTAPVTTAGATAGAFSMTMSRADHVQVYVSGVDLAGNLSTPAQVHNVIWTSTYDELVPNNPNQLETAFDFLLTPAGAYDLGLLDQVPTLSVLNPGNAGLAAAGDSSTLAVTAATAVWLDRTLQAVTTPPARYLQGTAYDSGRGRTVMFGGESGTPPIPVNDTWEWDGTQWISITPPASPPARTSMAMVYDAAMGATLLFGGETMTGYLNDTWAWNGANWTNVTPASPVMAELYGMSMSYDSNCGCAFMFGGINAAVGFTNAMWMWNGTTWTNVTPTGTSPSARLNAAMAFDGVEGATVLFGGSSSAGGDLNDTWLWTWNTSTGSGTWTNPTISTPPPIRDTASLAYDSIHGVLVLFGGLAPTITSPSFVPSSTYADTWTWNGTTWTKQTPATSPGSRYGANASYDSSNQRLNLFGGVQVVSNAFGAYMQDSWEWNGTTWAEVTPSTNAPGTRGSPATAFDSVADKTVMFSGCTGASGCGTVATDTWVWNGLTWQNVTPSGTSPPGRYWSSMVFDANHGASVIFGGFSPSLLWLNDTWTWNETAWTNVTPSSGNPAARQGPAMAYDIANKVTVMFGGRTGSTSTPANSDLADTWIWNGTTWTQKSPSTVPPARSLAQMAYDSVRGRVVMYGGVSMNGFDQALGDTWEWNTSAGTWTQVAVTGCSTCPPDSYQGALVYDAARGLSVLYGGATQTGSTTPTNNVYGWNGTSWIQFSAAPSAPQLTPRDGAAVAYDSARHRTVVFGGGSYGGMSAQSYYNDTWELPSDASESGGDGSRRAGAIMQISFGAAGETAPVIQSMTFDTYAGAQGYALTIPGVGAASPGATLAAWDSFSGAWRPLTTNAAGLTSFPELKYTTGSAAEANRYLEKTLQDISFAVYPTSGQGNGVAPPEVVLDYAALTVQYTH